MTWESIVKPVDHALERMHAVVRQRIDDEVVYVMSEAELAQYRDERLNAMVLELRSHVLAERLEPDVQRVTFARHVPVADSTRMLTHVPRTRWDAVKLYLLPGWLKRRLSPGRTRVVRAWVQPRYRTELVNVDEEVRIERAMTFPGATVRFPKELGNPVYREWRA